MCVCLLNVCVSLECVCVSWICVCLLNVCVCLVWMRAKRLRGNWKDRLNCSTFGVHSKVSNVCVCLANMCVCLSNVCFVFQMCVVVSRTLDRWEPRKRYSNLSLGLS